MKRTLTKCVKVSWTPIFTCQKTIAIKLKVFLIWEQDVFPVECNPTVVTSNMFSNISQISYFFLYFLKMPLQNSVFECSCQDGIWYDIQTVGGVVWSQ